MSMSAAQSDELRKMAAAMSERGSAIGLDYGMGRGLVDAAWMMSEAADTIESLRDRLQERETCELEPLPAIVVTMNMLNEIGWCKCSKCGYATPDESNYCQNCGREVVDA